MNYIYITAFMNEEFFIPVKQGMKDAANMLGVSSEFTGTPDANTDTLLAMARDAIDKGYDGIALNLIQPDVFTGVIQEAREAGIPVVAFNIDDPKTGRMAGVVQDFYNAGTVLGRRVLQKLPKGTTVLTTMHDPEVGALEERLQGILDILKPAGFNIKTIISGNTPELARDTILSSLSPDIGGILGTGQSDTEGAGLAVKTVSGSKPYAAGFDVSDGIKELIQEGLIDFSIDQQPYVQGFYPLLMMYQHKKHGVLPFDIDTGSDMIDKKTLSLK